MPNPWDLDPTDSNEDNTLILASQTLEKELSKSCELSNCCGSLKSTARLQEIRKGGIPKTTKKNKLTGLYLGELSDR